MNKKFRAVVLVQEEKSKPGIRRYRRRASVGDKGDE